MKKQTAKMIAPIIIMAIAILAALSYIVLLVVGVESLMPGTSSFVRGIAIVLAILVIAVCLLVLIERIKEIEKGEDDDLSKY